jgi:hypothetical protein
MVLGTKNLTAESAEDAENSNLPLPLRTLRTRQVEPGSYLPGAPTDPDVPN